jgi:hypothetical protein
MMKENQSRCSFKKNEDCVQLELDLFKTDNPLKLEALKILSFDKFKKKKEDEEFYRDVHETVARLKKKYY